MKKSGKSLIGLCWQNLKNCGIFLVNFTLILDPNAHVSKRTHQLKYLVELAKANETRLNQLWSNAKQSSRTTAIKYGW